MAVRAPDRVGIATGSSPDTLFPGNVIRLGALYTTLQPAGYVDIATRFGTAPVNIP